MVWLYWTYLIALVFGLSVIILILGKELLYWIQQRRGILGFDRKIVPSWKERYKLVLRNNSEQQVVLTDIHCLYHNLQDEEKEAVPVKLGMTSLPILEKNGGTYTLVLMHLDNQGSSQVPRNLIDLPKKSVLHVAVEGLKNETKEQFSVSANYEKTNGEFIRPLLRLGKLWRR